MLPTLARPLLAYGLVYGDVTLSADADNGAANVQELRIMLIAATTIILATFFAGGTQKREDGELLLVAGKEKGWFLIAIYLFWTAYIVARAMGWP